jgi:hypothetical protein
MLPLPTAKMIRAIIRNIAAGVTDDVEEISGV